MQIDKGSFRYSSGSATFENGAVSRQIRLPHYQHLVISWLNVCFNSDLKARGSLSIRNQSVPVPENRSSPIFFFGLSGVGKTTLIHQLAESSDLFYIPKFTVTRPPRDDDDPRYFEYLSADAFLRLKEQGKLFVWMDQEGVYYGYRSENLTDPNRHPLLNASAYGIEAVSRLKGVKVLIEGDAKLGLLLRQNPEMAKTREKVNRIAYEKFFGREDFRGKMNIIYSNQFGNPSESAIQLKREILKEMDHAK